MSKPTRPETGGPAFPRPASVDPTHGDLFDGNRVVPEHDGMTLRDYFAGQALASALGASGLSPTDPLDRRQRMAEWCYGVADAMLAARGKSAR